MACASKGCRAVHVHIYNSIFIVPASIGEGAAAWQIHPKPIQYGILLEDRGACREECTLER